ncbi:hypothetical protein SAMN04488523_101269 [Sulfitobacter brevis]|uniref:DUF2125 domain-containing protein n=2 Tax=Sulfitobacter brevis TaxID=74348 RepID=A0A1I1T415_9RHOB|nr:hypothetical protein SAMN04488523_101269 [Sulfitobacter brevis]
MLIWLGVLLAIVWGVWWWAATTGAERAVNVLLQDRRSAGWDATITQVDHSGFPLRLQTQISDLTLSDPAHGFAIELDRLTASAPAWWPGYLTLALPDTPIEIIGPAGRATAHLTEGQIDLRLKPGQALEVQALSATSGAVSLETPDGVIASADQMRLAAVQEPATKNAYSLEVNAANIVPGPLTRAVLGVPEDFPVVLDDLTADVAVSFDRAWDRRALERNYPQPRRIEIRQALATWGPVGLSAAGDVIVDEAGVPDGSVTLVVQNWLQMLDFVQATGAFPPARRTQFESVLRALSNMGGDADNLNLKLDFKAGQMAVGPIPLGPAPKLILR